MKLPGIVIYKYIAVDRCWGFHGIKGKQVIFNAHSESVREKLLFQDSARHRWGSFLRHPFMSGMPGKKRRRAKL